jgi:hypothetical protein
VAWVDKNPASLSRPSKLPRATLQIPDPADVRRLIARADQADPKWGLLLSLAVVTGPAGGSSALCGGPTSRVA